MQLTLPKNSPGVQKFIERLWDLWCIVSIVGIWPRFIEPYLICTSRKQILLPDLPREFDGLKIAHISDLHISNTTSKNYLARITKHLKKLSPDLIVFTGDFISYSKLNDPDKLFDFFSSLSCPLGIYAVLGNHDYAEYVSLAEDNTFRKMSNQMPTIIRGLSRLFSIKNHNTIDPKVEESVAMHDELVSLIKKAGIQLLHNETVHIGKTNSWINLTGLGDQMTANCAPSVAFRNYDMHVPGIVLSHSPDSFSGLQAYPGNLFLFGHTHGGQVNIPGIWQRITPLKNKIFKSGLFHINDRYLYVNRGLGQAFNFRWFAPPEIALFTLVRKGKIKERMWQNIFQKKPAPEAACTAMKV